MEENNMKEKKSLQEVLRENKIKIQQERMLEAKRQERKINIGIVLGLLILVISLVTLVIMCNQQTKKAIDYCMEDGNTYNYCVERLS